MREHRSLLGCRFIQLPLPWPSDQLQAGPLWCVGRPRVEPSGCLIGKGPPLFPHLHPAVPFGLNTTLDTQEYRADSRAELMAAEVA